MTDVPRTDLQADKETLKDLENLLSGISVREGKQWTTTAHRSTAEFPALNQHVCRAVSASGMKSQLSEHEVWPLIDQVFQGIKDDDFERPELLAAKILLGLVETPDWGDRVPMPGEIDSRERPTLRELRTNEMGVKSRAEFATNITLRRAYAAPLLVVGSTAPATFRKNRTSGPLRRVAKALLEAILAQVETLANSLPDVGVSSAVKLAEATAENTEPAIAQVAELPAVDLEAVPQDLAADTAPEEPTPTPTPSVSFAPTHLRRRTGWLVAAVAATAIIGIVVAGTLISKEEERLKAAAYGAGQVAMVEDALATSSHSDIWRYSEMLESVNLEHCNNVAPTTPPDGQELLRAWSWQDDSCLTSSLLVDPDEPFGIWVAYQNRTEQQTDDVTVWMELPDGFALVEGSTFWSNYSHQNGNFTASDLEDPGVNLGSYGTKANVAVVAQVRVTNPEVACAETQQPIRVSSISSIGRKDQIEPDTDIAYVSCQT